MVAHVSQMNELLVTTDVNWLHHQSIYNMQDLNHSDSIILSFKSFTQFWRDFKTLLSLAHLRCSPMCMLKAIVRPEGIIPPLLQTFHFSFSHIEIPKDNIAMKMSVQ